LTTVSISPPPLRAVTISDSLAAHLEGLIVSGELAPGSRLPSERDLAARWGVSRSSVREALQELCAKRLVDRSPGRGTVVRETSDDVRALLGLGDHEPDDAAELRLVIEPQIAALAAERATRSAIVTLDETLRRADASQSAERSVELDQEFHLLLAQATGNPLLSTMLGLANTWTLDHRRQSHRTRRARQESIEGHALILQAVVAGDAAAASQAMSAHLASVRQLVAESARFVESAR